MRKGRMLILSAVLIIALAVTACKSSGDDDNAAAAVVGTTFITAMGGNSVDGGGGPGGMLQVMSQAQGSLLNWGSFTLPAPVMPAGALLITEDTVWDETLNDALNDSDGLYVAPGVTITVPDDAMVDSYYVGYPIYDWVYIYGLQGYTYGPAVIMGNIIADSNNTSSVICELYAGQNTPTDDNTILLTGTIDMSGPSMSDDDAVDGGYVFLTNNYYQDTSFGIYISGNILANGGDATDPVGDYDGGRGGFIGIFGGDNEDILIRGNITANGGDAAGDGNAGFGGGIVIINNSGGPTLDSTGQIAFFDVNQVNLDGGDGAGKIGFGGSSMLRSDRSGWLVTAPMYMSAGDSTAVVPLMGTSKIGGGVMIFGNGDQVEEEDIIGDSNIIVMAPITGSGGSSPDYGAPGSMVGLITMEGNLYVSEIIDVHGGSATQDNSLSYGGDGGYGYFITYNYEESFAYGNAEWTVIRDVIADGGNGGEYGGDGGLYYSINYSTGTIYLPPAFVANRGGTGTVADGKPGMTWIIGDTVSIPFFPTLDQMP